MRELEKESESIKEVTRSYTNEISQGFTGNYEQYDSPYSESGSTTITVPIRINPLQQIHPQYSASATQGAEVTVSHEPAVTGTVARNPYSDIPAEPVAGSHPEPEKHANG